MAKGRASLAELMGKDGANKASSGKLTLEHLPAILGDAMPDLPKNAIGRHRLVSALHQRFGAGFRSLPGVSGIVEDFDKHVAFEQKIQKLKSIKPRR